jgi:opacity protein-like surface antigen
MRHLLLSPVAAAAIAVVSMPIAAPAADLAVSPPPPVPYFSWTGLYAGVHLGAGWSRKDWSDPFPAPVFGDRVDASGAVAGGQIGFNYQLGWFVWGVEADAAWAHLEGTNTCFATIGGVNCGVQVRSVATIAARLGYAIDRNLLYIKGGGAWVNDRYDLNLIAFGLGTPSTTATNWGWTIGGGVEHALLPNWTVKLEYNYIDVGSKTVAFAVPPPFDSFSIDQRVHVAKLGVNYLFGGGAVAKY